MIKTGVKCKPSVGLDGNKITSRIITNGRYLENVHKIFEKTDNVATTVKT